MGTNGRKKLTRSELKRNIWLLKRVDGNEIILRMHCIYERSPILDIDMQVWLVHIEIFSSNIYDGGIDLDAINRYRPIDLRELVRNCATRQADDANTMQLLWCETSIEIGRSEEIIPILACQNYFRIGIIDGVDGLPLVENEFPHAIGLLGYLNI